MKKLLSIAAVASLALASGNFIMPYGGYIDYSKESIKDYGVLGGVYFSKLLTNTKIELDLEHTYIRYKDDAINDYHQSDATVLLNFFRNNISFKVGNHSIFINQDNNSEDYDNIFILGVNYYKYLKYNIGINYYYSKYDAFNVKQYSPYVGYNFGDYYSQYGSFYAKAQVNFINLSSKSVTGKKNYVNYDFSLSNYVNKWTTTLKASVAKSIYKVSNEGFVVYNLAEIYKDSFGIDVNYKIDKKSSVKVGYTYSEFEESNINASSSVYFVSYLRAF